MYPVGEAQTATRPVGNCVGRRAERMMHTIEKASSQADSRIDMFWKCMRIDVRLPVEMAPSAVPGAPWGPSGARRSPKSSQKHTQRDPKETQGRPLGAPGASQERPRVPKERPEGAQERSWETSGEAKSTSCRFLGFVVFAALDDLGWSGDGRDGLGNGWDVMA